MSQENVINQENIKVKPNSKAYETVLCGLLISLVFIFTKFVQFQLPGASGGGLVHLGNVMVFAFAIVFGPKRGFIAAAFGMGLFDILSGWVAYAPITFIGKGVMAYIAGTFAYMLNKNGESIIFNSIGILFGGIAMILTYYIGEAFMYGNMLTPIANIPGNITQIVIGFALGMPFAVILKKYKYFNKMYNS